MSRENRQFGQFDAQAGDLQPDMPSHYRILLLDDRGAPASVIEGLLESIFHMGRADARRAARSLRRGVGAMCGVYLYEIAETKASEAIAYAGARRCDLQMTLERA